jgi:AcrR family transcriptional regulator
MTPSAPSLRRLPSGRHSLSKETVADSQRRRLQQAVVEVVGRRGWSATRISDVVSAAEVSRQTFYEQFPALDACFAAALQTGLDDLLARLDDAAAQVPISSTDDLATRLHAFFEGYVAALSSAPGYPVALHVETLRASDLVRAVRAEVIETFADRMRKAYDAARERQPDLPARPLAYFRMLTGGLDELMRETIRNEGAERALATYARAATDLVVQALVP